jgi:hypothetical protein
MTISNPTNGPNELGRRSEPLTNPPPVVVQPQAPIQKRVTMTAGIGSGAEALAGIGAIALAILGLAGILPFTFAAIAALAIGAGLLLKGIAIAGSFAEAVRRHLLPADPAAQMMLSGDLSAQALGGAAGVALAILALVGVSTWVLLAVAAIVFGGTILVGGSSRPELVNDEVLSGGAPAGASSTTAGFARASGGAAALAGLATLTLGIVGLVNAGASMHTLVLVAFLVAGSANLLSGSALLGRVADVLR